MNREKPFFVSLPQRGRITVGGEDRHAFLQNLISNDIRQIAEKNSLYACLLTPQGKFLHDFIIYEFGDELIIDCEGGARAKDLYARLMMYKLRSPVTLAVEENAPSYAILSCRQDSPPVPNCYPDPRHPDMGWRCHEKPNSLPERTLSDWDEHRLKYGVPDGSRDMVIEKSTLLECHIDKFNGICLKKGCYVGQELTARMHYRGLAKKHLYIVHGNPLPPSGADIMSGNNILAGDMRSQSGTIGLALLKDDIIATPEKAETLPFIAIDAINIKTKTETE